MSVAMVASFMPSLAFAASCNFVLGSTATWDEVQKVLNSDDAKYVSEVKAPKHGENGSAVVTCKEDFCDNTQNVTITMPCKDSDAESVTMWKEEYASKALEQEIFKNEAQANQWLKNNADMCRVTARICKTCGKIIGTATATNHSTKPTDLNVCQGYVCTDCGKEVKATAEHTPKAPTTKKELKSLEKVSAPTCGHGTGYKVPCSVCGKDTVWYHDTAVDGVASDMKTDAHNFGATVDSSKATKETKTGYELLPGYVAHKVGSENYTGRTFTTKNIGEYKFYELNTVVSEGTDCASKRYGLKCTVCGKVVVNNVQGKHDFEKTHVAATCDHAGYNKLVCKVCGTVGENESLAKTEPKLAHSYKVTKKDATCTTGEKYVVECTTCSEKTCATNHKMTFDLSHTTGLTLVDNSSKEVVIYSWAGLDNELKGKNALEFTFAKNTSKAHKYGNAELLKPATCTTDEVWGKKCTECGKVNHALVTVKTGTKLGHKFKETEVPATCGTAGYKTAMCENCGEYKTATGTTKDADKALKTQTAKPIVAPGAKCTMDKWVVTKAATVFEEGIQEAHCSKCNATTGQIVPVAKAKYAAPTVKAGKKSITVTAQATEGATSYKISYKKAGGKCVTKTVEAGKKVTIKKLAKGKKYTVKAVAINADGVKVFSATKTVKTK